MTYSDPILMALVRAKSEFVQILPGAMMVAGKCCMLNSHISSLGKCTCTQHSSVPQNFLAQALKAVTFGLVLTG